MTPYERHKALGHKTTQHSPNGIDKIEQCTECPAKYLHQPRHRPVTMFPYYFPPDAQQSRPRTAGLLAPVEVGEEAEEEDDEPWQDKLFRMENPEC